MFCAAVTTTIRLRFNGVRRPFDCLSKVIKVTATLPASRSHADLFIYLDCSASAHTGLHGRNVSRRTTVERQSSRSRIVVVTTAL